MHETHRGAVRVTGRLTSSRLQSELAAPRISLTTTLQAVGTNAPEGYNISSTFNTSQQCREKRSLQAGRPEVA